MVDAQGFAIGVIRMKLREARGIGFAIAINVAKDWLESRSLDQFLPTRRFRVGAPDSLPGKAIRMRLPEAFADGSPSRLRVEGRLMPQEVWVMVDRVASPASLTAAEALVRSGRGLPGVSGTSPAEPRPVELGGRPGLLGSLHGSAPSSFRPWQTEYALLDLGREKVVARYAGPPEAIAFNLGAIRASLRSLQAEPLLTGEIRSPLAVRFAEARALPAGGPALQVPERWVSEAVGPPACRGLPRPNAVLAASPEGDFTVSLRAAWWSVAPTAPEKAAGACAPGAAAASGYATRRTRFGEPYSMNGVFFPLGGGLVRLELEVPPEKEPFVRDVYGAWLGLLRRSPP